ncbi:chitinase-3-like protein 1 [Biomphalaria glabrata]|uniref:Chitinase-3-like protein 1 n=1 Tax=Biomphalaria glabrata TaxID=6526 RepID=A0A9W3AFD7_BIOGL|nr:chitinase-3-like protein 1 [Biomphalaria glabrata]
MVGSVVIFLVLSLIQICYGSQCQRRVCYYTNWSQYRSGVGKFLPEDIDPFLCTHLIFAFAKVKNSKIEAVEWNDEDTDVTKGLYSRLNKLKEANPELKTLLAVGGASAGSTPFTEMVATAETRRSFVETSIVYLRQRNFDGLDLDWEYPGNSGLPEDKHRFTLLVQELAAAFENESRTSGRPRLILSAAVASGKENIDAGYEVREIAESLDMINLMSYDFHGSWESVTGHNSPLYSRTGETGPAINYNTDFAAKYWVELGTPKAKLNIGLATYGRTFILSDERRNSVGDPASGPGAAGAFTSELGFLAFYEICPLISAGAVVRNISDQQVPYLTFNLLWAGYDDVASLRNKVQFIKRNGYGGTMIWSLDSDDIRGTSCGAGTFPLTRAVAEECDVSDDTTTFKPQDITETTPSAEPTSATTAEPTDAPTAEPTDAPTAEPTNAPTAEPTNAPTAEPTNAPTAEPTNAPTAAPTNAPTDAPTNAPTDAPTNAPTDAPTNAPTDAPTNAPTDAPTNAPTDAPTNAPTDAPTNAPSDAPTNAPTAAPTNAPTAAPVTTERPTSSAKINSDSMCSDLGLSDGNYADPNSCSTFISCSGLVTYIMPCPAGLVYNVKYDYCDWSYNVPECSV